MILNTSGTYSGVKYLLEGDMEISFIIPKANEKSLLKGVDEITKKQIGNLAIKVDKERKKRSLDANDYLWVLCTKLAEELEVSKETVYRLHIKEAGQYQSMALQEKAVEAFCNLWSINGTGWFTEVVDSTLNGCKKVFAYYGSSAYDTAQMSRLIKNVIQDCEAQEIETMSPRELESLLDMWGERNAG